MYPQLKDLEGKTFMPEKSFAWEFIPLRWFLINSSTINTYPIRQRFLVLTGYTVIRQYQFLNLLLIFPYSHHLSRGIYIDIVRRN